MGTRWEQKMKRERSPRDPSMGVGVPHLDPAGVCAADGEVVRGGSVVPSRPTAGCVYDEPGTH